MQIQIVGKGIELSEALRTRITNSVTEGVKKYSNRSGEAYVTVHKNNYDFEVHCSLHLSSGAMLQARGEGGDAYSACEQSVVRLEKRLRRYKRKLKNHHHTQKDSLPAEEAYFYVIESKDYHIKEEHLETLEEDPEEDSEEGLEENHAPAIIAEHPGELRTLTVGMAVQEMDLTDTPALVFRNASHGRLNVVMRRADGHISWIDPERRQQ